MNGFEGPHQTSPEENNPAVQESIRDALDEIDKKIKAEEAKAKLKELLG